MNCTRLVGFSHYCKFLHKSVFSPPSNQVVHPPTRSHIFQLGCSMGGGTNSTLTEGWLLSWSIARANHHHMNTGQILEIQSYLDLIPRSYLPLSATNVSSTLHFAICNAIDVKMLAFNLRPRSIKLNPQSFVQTHIFLAIPITSDHTVLLHGQDLWLNFCST